MARTARSTLPLFVYGTLRPGMHNWPMISDSVVRHRPAVIDDFALYNVGRGPMPVYPVMVSQEGSKVLGELLIVTQGADLQLVHGMEIGAGYALDGVWVPAAKAGGEPELAAAFVWFNKVTGWPVPNGDWAAVPEPTEAQIATARTQRKNRLHN
jgi:gamma-glutamylcyclotransferase (GGCT)/AIG2-like uncharacterized protein YtfP